MKTTKKPPYFIHESSYIDAGASVGTGSKIWHFCHIQSGAQIGQNCILGQNVNIGNDVKIGDTVKIQNNVSVYSGVTVEDGVFLGPSMVFTNVLNPRAEFPQPSRADYATTLVRRGASIGANATIICGTTIGRYSLIGAGSVVTKPVPDFAVMVGNPARKIGWVCCCGKKLKFSGKKARCSCKRSYERRGDNVAALSAAKK